MPAVEIMALSTKIKHILGSIHASDQGDSSSVDTKHSDNSDESGAESDDTEATDLEDMLCKVEVMDRVEYEEKGGKALRY